jgi:hypothetical protein
MEEPEQWQLLADGYCAAGCSEAAIALVTDKLGGLGKAHERCGPRGSMSCMSAALLAFKG